MWDFHTHTSLSFDSESSPHDMLASAAANGIKEICFTDHYDLHEYQDGEHNIFTIEDYKRAFDSISCESLKIRRGVETGLALWNKDILTEFINSYPFDFVIGSIHFAGGYDPYFPEFWEHYSVREAFEKYLLQTLKCVKLHDNFDVLGHLTYVCKSPNNPTHEPLLYKDFSDITDEILKILVDKGRGIEVNTSGYSAVGEPLPSRDFIKRYKELGGEIITIGSDAHVPEKIGQFSKEALTVINDIFGYVCTFDRRKPIYHKL